ncbi:putative type 1 phosphatase regulator ypi1 [Aspergillus fumigatus Z5]|nr:putative type 1 phosphatase regulator ypi1 [Aspergillus fumigatus Z5]
MSRTRQVPSNTASSSHIQLLSPAVPQENHSTVRISGTLRLRAENDSIATDHIEGARPGRHIRWTEDVVDNEGLGKKSSKGESSSESDDSTSSSSEPESDNDVDCRDSTGRAENHEQNAQDASQSPSNRSLNRGRTPSYTKRQAKRNGKRKPSPNAYEKMPKVKGQPRKTGM